MKVQWFIHHKEYLNYICFDIRETSKNYEIIYEKFESLLTVITTYLRSSGFICYQILQIFNELLRILYAFQLTNPQRFLKEDIITYQKIEQGNVWKTGIEFEITMMKIMIMNSQTNSTEGKDRLINFFIELGKSIVSLDLLQKLIEGGQYLLKKMNRKTLIYYCNLLKLFFVSNNQMVNYKIITVQTASLQINLTIKGSFSLAYIRFLRLNFTFQLDILAYRPVINKSIFFKGKKDQSSIQWNKLIQFILFHKVRMNKKICTIFLISYKSRAYIKYQQLGLNNYNLKIKMKKNSRIMKSFQQVMNMKILENLINTFKSNEEEIIIIHQRIIQSFESYFKEPSKAMIQIVKDDQVTSFKQFLEAYKKRILLSNQIYDLSKFEVAKFHKLKPQLEEFEQKENQKSQENIENLKSLLIKIDDFVQQKFNELIPQPLNSFLIAIIFISCSYEFNLFLETKQEKDLNQIRLEIYFGQLISKTQTETLKTTLKHLLLIQ
ncbi:unnamed protein product [Paramecium sonneborni]|uniref:Uncharacterized protein n=1 Tax=Paramecium sonneborni TaxID=65129 RepID=A0A8S1RNR3_9CILI|nr:unnamed protein product [Paramecium sonneborni]